MAKREKEVHRLNLAIELDLLETLRETARKRFNAPLHHVSGQPEISSTIVKLLELGLKALNDEEQYVFDEDKPQSLQVKFDGLATELNRLRERVQLLESTYNLTQISIQEEHTSIEDDELDDVETTTQIDTHKEDIKREENINIEQSEALLQGQVEVIEVDATQIDTQIKDEDNNQLTIQIEPTKDAPQNPDSDLKEDQEAALPFLSAPDLIKSKSGKPPAVPSKSKVRSIRNYAANHTLEETKAYFGVTQSTLAQIKKRVSPYDFD